MSEFTPFLISWNVTKRCNLHCGHCYLDASTLAPPLRPSGTKSEIESGLSETIELSTIEALKLIDDISFLAPGAMLILTGGEPLARGDIFDLAGHASERGLSVVLGTNGTLLTEETVLRLKEKGVKGVGLSIDSLDPLSHDTFRGLNGAWESTVKGIEYLNKHGIEFQLQLSVTKGNYEEVEDIVEFACQKGAKAMNVFFLVCTGRGQEMTDITPQQYEKVLVKLSDLDKKYSGKLMVRGRCAPHFLRVVQQKDPDSPVMKGATSGCIAGTHYFRITPDGDVTPCPYMPTVVGNIRKQGLADIWNNSSVFHKLRNPSYNGRCADCEFSDVCGGCRARALAASGDLMGEDPWCEHKPEEGKSAKKSSGEIIWEDAAAERLKAVPIFLRSMVKKGIERYAKTKGLAKITPEMMEDMRKKVSGGGRRPV